MGACATKPRDLDLPEAQLPGNRPLAPEPVVEKEEGEAPAAQENKNEEAPKEEEPLVDLSEPAKEEPKTVEGVAAELNDPVADLVAVVADAEQAPVAKQSEDKVVAATETQEEAPKVKVEEPKVEAQEEKPKQVDEAKAPEVKAENLKKKEQPSVASK